MRPLTLAGWVAASAALAAAPAAGRTVPVAGALAAPAIGGLMPGGRTSGYNADRNAYFGDLHVHTGFSFDAYIFNVRATPDDAYRYARGETIRHALGYDVRLTDEPLDFMAVTDHAEYLGVLPAMNDPTSPLSKIPYAPDLFSPEPSKIQAAFTRIANSLRDGTMLPELKAPETSRAAWREIVASAERFNTPGQFTTFIGYEFTSAPGGRNLHRNVIFAGGEAPEIPYTALDSQNPENLWRWLDAQRASGREALAIPHNSNGSDGTMFERTDWAGRPIDAAYAALRMRNEPLAEITQVKGTSETHPSLSPNDEWAGFEILGTYIGSNTQVTRFDGGYVRRAMQTGLEMQVRSGFNPYRFGFIGASDTHNGAMPLEEERFFGKVGAMDGSPERRGSVPPGGAADWDEAAGPAGNLARYQAWGASGLTGVWAEENTREAIYAAFRRKETFATSGPRIRVRMFAGYDYPADILGRRDMVRTAYARGVAQGGDLIGRKTGAPKFIVWALRDANSGWLQRVQIVKGWVENGEAREQVFDVACSDGLTPDAKTHRCGDNGATVDPKTCRPSRDKGAVELKAVWSDPTFRPGQHAFYYTRVLENPSCRWSTWDALRAGTPPNPDLPRYIQERAWSSAIWFTPRS